MLLRVPRGLGAGHLYDGAADAPHVAAPPVLLASQHLGKAGVSGGRGPWESGTPLCSPKMRPAMHRLPGASCASWMSLTPTWHKSVSENVRCCKVTGTQSFEAAPVRTAGDGAGGNQGTAARGCGELRAVTSEPLPSPARPLLCVLWGRRNTSTAHDPATLLTRRQPPRSPTKSVVKGCVKTKGESRVHWTAMPVTRA